jgi:hypothetical protein
MARIWISGIILAIACVAPAAPARAVSKCKVKVEAKTGALLVSASEVVGTLTWGDAGSNAGRSFDNIASCVSGGKAKSCRFGSAGSLRAITPPVSCTVRVKDDTGTCEARVKGCTPGDRGYYAKDVNGRLLARCAGGFLGSCFIHAPDGRMIQIGTFSNSIFPAADSVYFDQPGCTGAMYMTPPSGNAAQLPNGEFFNGELHYPSMVAPTLVTTRSSHSSFGSCYEGESTQEVVPTLTMDVSAFQSPYSLDDMP